MPMVRRWMPSATPEQVVDRLCAYGAEMAFYTLGAEGAIARSPAGTFTYPAFPTQIVDTTGAGDAFHGAFIYGLLQDWPIHEIACFASAVAALNCGHLGGRSGLPDLAEVESFIAKNRKRWEAGIKSLA